MAHLTSPVELFVQGVDSEIAIAITSHDKNSDWHWHKQGGSEASKNGQKPPPEAAPAKTRSRHMAETTQICSQTLTSYLTLYIFGVSRLLLTVCRWECCIIPIIKHRRTCEKWPSGFVYPRRGRGAKMCYMRWWFNFWGPNLYNI